jgi:hypothetical protein
MSESNKELIECETCCGSGMVAYGPWGSRPPRKTCPDCNGTKVRETRADEDAIADIIAGAVMTNLSEAN